MKTKLNKKLLIIFGLILIALIVLIVLITHKSFADPLDNDVEVEPNTMLTYYLDVKSDGADKYGVKSDDTTTADIKSGVVTVTDKIPEGLTFSGFVTTSDGTIGAVKRSDKTQSCPGKVIDDTNEASPTDGQWNQGNTEYTYHGLHYDKASNTVSFKAEKIQAGCVLTVGIITQTPSTIDDPNTPEVEKRRDFYNFGEAVEGPLNVKSNTVHVFMGDDSLTTYNVTYTFTGTVPDGVVAPGIQNFPEGAKVGVANSPNVTGYTFSGWTTSDATVSDGKFTMPNNNVTFVGSFTEKPKHTVTYVINGTTPSGYVLPTTKSYSEGETVEVDSLKPGDVINGYKFLGWKKDGSSVEEFTMPNTDVVITGAFEEVKYTVTYKFHPGVLPDNSESLLPETKSYKAGTKVTLEDNPTASGYKFLGWYHEDNFDMPEEDITIYGEWMRQSGTFRPNINKEIVDEKNNYKVGDEVEFKITVKNNASFTIKDVMIKEEGGVFESRSGYTVLSDHMAKINTIAAGAQVELYAKYTVKNSDLGRKKNTAYLLGALADNNYTLEEGEYKSEVTYTVGSKLVITNTVKGNMANVNEYFKFKVVITGQTGDTYTISGQDSSITYGGSQITPSTTYTVGEEQDQYIYLKHGQSVTIGDSSNDNSIMPGTSYSIIEQEATSYETYINESSTNSKETGTLEINSNNSLNQVDYVNIKNGIVPTGKMVKDYGIYILGAIVLIGLIIFIIIKRRPKQK